MNQLKTDLERARNQAPAPNLTMERLHLRRWHKARVNKVSAFALTLAMFLTLGGFILSQGRGHNTVGQSATASMPSSTPSLGPTGQDIGFGVPWCDLSKLGGLDLLGNGTNGTAWTGMRTNKDGSCPTDSAHWRVRVAVDVNGDGLADSYSQPMAACRYTGCAPLGASDLDADGDQELVIHTNFTIVDHLYFSATRRRDGGVSLAPIVVAAPGDIAAGIKPGAPLITSAAGDAGYSGWMRCEGYPKSPILVWTFVNSDLAGKKPSEWHETKLQLREVGNGPPMFHVVANNDFTLPPNQDPGLIRSTKPACGLDFNIWVPPN